MRRFDAWVIILGAVLVVAVGYSMDAGWQNAARSERLEQHVEWLRGEQRVNKRDLGDEVEQVRRQLVDLRLDVGDTAARARDHQTRIEDIELERLERGDDDDLARQARGEWGRGSMVPDAEPAPVIVFYTPICLGFE